MHKKNTEAMNTDSYVSSYLQQSTLANNPQTQDVDKDVTDGLIEVIITTTEENIIIHANNYPVYIGKNFFGFINYVVQSATDETQPL